MYASIAGLKTHMQKLSVIGNNIANVNTQGYKTQRTVFRDSIYRNYKSGSDGTSTVGGMNPSQLGYGSIIGSIDIDMSSSSYNPGNSMDCALVGDGFFLVGNKEVAQSINPNNPDSFKSLTLTRVGDFHFDADGYLVDGDGNCVYGFMNTNTAGENPWGTGAPYNPVEGNGFKTLSNGKTVPNVSDQLVPIRKPYWEKVTVPAVEEDGKIVTPETSKYIIHYAQTPEVNNAGGGNATGAVGPLTDDKQPAFAGNNNQGGADTGTVRELEVADLNSIAIDAGTGAITGFVKGTDELITIGYLAIGSVSNPNGVSHAGDSYYKCQAGAGDLNISMLGGVQNDLGINYVNGSTVARANQNQGGGNQGGTTNSTVRDDLPRGSEIISTGNTKMMTGFLEAPNVDLATEISELITTQRGYQANTRIITVTDSMLEELVNMKR